MNNPFEDEEGTYVVLVNDEKQYSLWPNYCEVPAGWNVAKTDDTRQACLNYITENWKDMRPLSLVTSMKEVNVELSG